MAIQKLTDSMRTTVALDATKLSGAVPTGSLGNAPATDLSILEYNQAILGFKLASSNQLTKFSMVDQVIDEFQDATGIDAGASNNENAGGATTAKYYEGATGSDPTGGASVDTSVTGYKTHVFTGDASLTVTTPGNVDILVVAGGGSGGYDYGGGAGAGGLIYKTSHALTANTYDAVIGDGGAAKTSAGVGNNGADSTWTINGGAVQFTAKGGGGGGLSTVTAGTGGSGGGGGHAHSGYYGSGAIQDGIYDSTDQSSVITVTTNDITLSGGAWVNFVDANSGTWWDWGNGSSVSAGSYIRFAWSAAQLIKEFKWYHSNASDTFGTWQLQGSNNASAWTNIGSTFVVSGLSANSPHVGTELNGNTNSYLYYQLVQQGTVGTNSNNHSDRIFFKRATTESHTYGFGYAGGDGTPSPSYDTGGGGGAGSVGADASGSGSGNGGTGKDMSAIFGTAVGESGWFASGGGGGLTSDGTAQEGTASNGGGTAGGNTSGPSAAGQANTGGGSGGGANGTYKSTGAGGSGVILVRYATSAFMAAGQNLTLQSQATAASGSAPTTANLVLLIEDSGSGTADLATDIKAKVSRASTANFTGYVTFTDEGNWGTDKRILRSSDIDLTGTNTGTSMRYKIETFNQSAGVKETRIHATSLAWA